ncbi:protein kinase [Clostridium botulinum]
MSSEKYKFNNGKLEVNIENEWKSIKCTGYDLLEVIGEGANGVVVKAEHQITERIDAIKIWLPHKKAKNGKVSQEQYLREVRKISKLKDEHIVTIYDARILYDEVVYICAMEYIDGKSLKEWIKGDHDISDRIKICKEILQTVENYQKAGIIHGDLHGGNIIIDKELHTHIIDFGTSLFGHDNQSKERESNFVYDLVKKIMKDEFKTELFSIKNYDISSEIKYKDDARRYEPLLITRTMLQFVKLRDIKDQTVKMTDRDVLIEYCESIAKGIYFDLEKVYSELLSWSDGAFVIPIFAEVLYANIYDTIFDPMETNDYEELMYTTLYIYYEIFKNCKKNVSIDNSKKHYMKTYHGFLSEEKYNEYINDLYEFKCKSYIEYRRHLTTICDEENLYEREENVRGILADLIKKHYGQTFIYVLYEVWQRLNEIRVNEKLHYEIISM